MNFILQIFVVALCIGVTYSSPAVSDAKLAENSTVVGAQKPPEHDKNQTLPLVSTTQSIPTVLPVSTTNSSDVNNINSTITNTNNTDTKVNNNSNTNSTNTNSNTNSTNTNSTSINNEPTVGGNETVPHIIDNKNVSPDSKNMTSANSTSPEVPQQNNTNTTNTRTQSPIVTSTPTKKSTTNSSISETPTSTAASISAQTPTADHAIPTPANQESQFNGPSFVGGIVLTVGLTAIGFIAFKFYKSGKMEGTYRTLKN